SSVRGRKLECPTKVSWSASKHWPRTSPRIANSSSFSIRRGRTCARDWSGSVRSRQSWRYAKQQPPNAWISRKLPRGVKALILATASIKRPKVPKFSRRCSRAPWTDDYASRSSVRAHQERPCSSRRHLAPFGLDTLRNLFHSCFLSRPKHSAHRCGTVFGGAASCHMWRLCRRGRIKNKRHRSSIRKGRARGRQMRSCPAAIDDGERRHHLFSMPSTVFHQRPAEVAAGKAPRLTEISHAKMNIDIRPRKLREISRKTHHSGGFGPDLHEAYFPDRAERRRIVAAFDG